MKKNQKILLLTLFCLTEMALGMNLLEAKIKRKATLQKAGVYVGRGNYTYIANKKIYIKKGTKISIGKVEATNKQKRIENHVIANNIVIIGNNRKRKNNLLKIGSKDYKHSSKRIIKNFTVIKNVKIITK
jgi:hypothetical protein